MDGKRERFRQGLSHLFLPYYDALCENLPEEWAPYAGIRSLLSQDRLYAQGRTSPGGIVTNARGGESPHNYGCATDWVRWTMDGEPIWSDKEDPCWKEFINAVTSVGLRPGAEFGDVDHCELRIAVSWKTIGMIYRDKSMAAAFASIQAAMLPPAPFIQS